MKNLGATYHLRAGGRAFAHIAQVHSKLKALRRDLHAQPELGFEERFTVRRVADANFAADVPASLVEHAMPLEPA